MAIKYFPNSVHKKNPGAIDRVLAKRQVKTVRGYQNTTSTALNTYISANSDWQLDSIKFNFSNTSSRTYSAKIASGLKVVQDLNDSLWFHVIYPAGGICPLWQKIILSPGFYTGTTLATELQAKLNANATYLAASLTFTVAYDETTGLFTITPDTGGVSIKYLQTNTTQYLSNRDSMGGYLLGLTTTTDFAANVASDTAQYGLNTEAWIIDENDSMVTEHYNDDIHVLSIDQALHLASNVVSTEITYEVTYEEIV